MKQKIVKDYTIKENCYKNLISQEECYAATKF